jgi:hypothetical protein
VQNAANIRERDDMPIATELAEELIRWLTLTKQLAPGDTIEDHKLVDRFHQWSQAELETAISRAIARGWLTRNAQGSMLTLTSDGHAYGKARKSAGVPKHTPESIVKYTLDQIKTLRENALKLNASDIVDLCEAELARRRSAKKAKAKMAGTTRDRPVLGFHFVCPRETGVKKNQDGTIWSGTWVVQIEHAKRAVTIGSYVALHVDKSSPSYLQGIVKGWRRNNRESPESKIKCGIDFLLDELNDVPVAWISVYSVRRRPEVALR